jgi:hypothetical protein
MRPERHQWFAFTEPYISLAAATAFEDEVEESSNENDIGASDGVSK